VFFKLKAPHNAIGGFGLFARAEIIPAWLAWDSFGQANGAESFDAMVRRIEKYRSRERRDPAGNYNVGCLMISSPVFFEPRDWVRAPADWKGQIVSGRNEDLSAAEGRRVYEECVQRAMGHTDMFAEHAATTDETSADRYGAPLLVLPRLGQGTFRIAVTEAYERACAVTGEHSLPALDAAHIKPYGRSGSHAVSNGLLLRSDIHRLFDKGYVTVTPDLAFIVSPRLKNDFQNGRSYYPLHGRKVAAPRDPAERPAADLLSWHTENVFLHT
jgi:putative restriction endonuclease